MARLGIVGFTNSGKTTLFNALTGIGAPTAPHPYSTIEPNVGVAKIPDPKLVAAAQAEGSAKVVPATLDLLDLPPLSRQGPGAARQFFGQLREMEALVIVLKAFGDAAMVHDGIDNDPRAEAEELLLELAVADHEVFAKRAERLAKEAAADRAKQTEAKMMAEAAGHLGRGEALRNRAWETESLAVFRDLAPLTLKPAVWVINVDETERDAGTLVAEVSELVPEGDEVVAISARLEEEGAQLAPEERAELFDGLGLGEGALATMVKAAYKSLGLISFYTVGPKESRAWSVHDGALAPEAAGKIHSDLERGFIRAEVGTMDEVIAAGGWDRAKDLGAIRVEGKSYRVRPEDVLVIRFSV